MELLISLILFLTLIEAGLTVTSLAIRKYIKFKIIKSLADMGYKMGNGSLDMKAKLKVSSTWPAYVPVLNLINDYTTLRDFTFLKNRSFLMLSEKKTITMMSPLEKNIYEEKPTMFRAIFLQKFVEYLLPRLSNFEVILEGSRVHLRTDSDGNLYIIHVEGGMSFLTPFEQKKIVTEKLLLWNEKMNERYADSKEFLDRPFSIESGRKVYEDSIEDKNIDNTSNIKEENSERKEQIDYLYLVKKSLEESKDKDKRGKRISFKKK